MRGARYVCDVYVDMCIVVSVDTRVNLTARVPNLK